MTKVRLPWRQELVLGFSGSGPVWMHPARILTAAGKPVVDFPFLALTWNPAAYLI